MSGAEPTGSLRRRRWERRVDRKWRSLRRRLLATRLADTGAHLRSRELVHVFGDSHARTFDHMRRLRLRPDLWLDVLAIPSATCYGIGNTSSESGAGARFLAGVRRLPSGRTTVWMLGEVDCGYLCWSMAAQRNMTPEAVLERSLERYDDFLAAHCDPARVIIASAPYPTVEHVPSGRLRDRRDIDVALDARIEVTEWFNDRLEQMTRSTGRTWLDAGSALDRSTRRVRSELVVPGDHHYRWETHAALLAEALRVDEHPGLVDRSTARPRDHRLYRS